MSPGLSRAPGCRLFAWFQRGHRNRCVLVAVYLLLNVIVIGVGLFELVTHPFHFNDWKRAMLQHPSVNGRTWMIIALALMLFPKLALGLRL